ncbi:MAG: hypothetical protein ACM3X0_01065 [Bacteroidota bacterium]
MSPLNRRRSRRRPAEGKGGHHGTRLQGSRSPVRRVAKRATGRFYGDHFLIHAPGLAASVVSGAVDTLTTGDDSF